MRFISYAQTFEDVMLARALAGVERGFYIDVGAQDPRLDSVTKAFYDRGWHGINLEPVESWHRKLVAGRPRDINLCLAAGDHEGMIEFHETDDSGLSTASAEFARRHREDGFVLRTRQVPVSTLDAICRAHDVQVVHFLKVDVEGAEAEVLRGLDLSRLRPWIIVVEATEPNSRISTHARWESLVTTHGYRMVYQDGLNRFYLASEHEALAPAFDAPPNIFDDFVRREQVDEAAFLTQRLEDTDALLQQRTAHIAELGVRIGDLSAGLEQAHGELEQAHRELGQSQWLRDRLTVELQESQLRELDLRARIDAHQQAHAHTASELAEVRAQLGAVLGSRSWRLTAPMRSAVTRLRGVVAGVEEDARRLSRSRFARRLVAAALRPFPGVAAAIKRRLFGAVPEAAVAEAPLPLTEDAEIVLARYPVGGRGGDS